MNKTKTKEKILKATSGILTSITDYVLMNLEILGEILTIPAGEYTMANAQKAIFDTALGLNKKNVQRAICRAKSHGWIKKDLKLTKAGKEKLKNILPVFLHQKKWDKNWHLVIFDIPEKLRGKRNILREKLKKLGFGQLQQSVWISPINYLPVLEKLVFDYQLDPYVIFSQTSKIGREASQELAEKIWGLSELNKKYQKFVLEEEVKEKILIEGGILRLR